MLEDRGDDIRIFDAGDDAQRATALGAGLDVDGEDAFQALHPSHGGKGPIRLFVARFAFWHDGLAMLAIRREHAVEPGQVQSRTRDQRREAGDEVEWVEDDVGGAVAKRLLEPMDDLSPIIGREPLVGDGGPCDVATELFELVALGGFTDGGGVERKARLPGEQGGWEGFGLYRDGAQGQCLPVGVGPDGDPVVDRGADELIESLTGLEVEVVAVCIAHEQAKAFEQTGHPLADRVQQLRELGASRPWCPMKRRAASFEIVHPVEKEHMEVNVEVRPRTEPWIRVTAPVLAPEATVNPPGDRTKTGSEHRVPLSRRAIAVLREARVFRENNLVFPNATGRTMSDSTVSKLLRELGIAAVPHGFRSTFRDWCGEMTNAPREVAEAALGHKVGNVVEQADARSDLFEKRRALMESWARYLDREAGDVIELPRMA